MKNYAGQRVWYVYVHPDLHIPPCIESGVVEESRDGSLCVPRPDDGCSYGYHWDVSDRNLCETRKQAGERLCVEMRKRIRRLQREIRDSEQVIKRERRELKQAIAAKQRAGKEQR